MQRSKHILLFLAMVMVLCSFAVPALAGGDIVINPTPFQDRVAEFLTNEVISTVLLIIGIAGIVIEIFTVGSFGVFGAVGILSIALYFMGNMWSGSLSAASLWLLLAGVVLIVIEIFATPGFGVPGSLGALAMLASLVMASSNPAAAIWEVLIAVVLAALLIWLTLRNKKTRKVWGRFVLRKETDRDSGYSSADPAWSRFFGQQGRALTMLRPAGTADLNGERVDVVTRGEFIEPGQRIEVIQVEGVRIVVRQIEDPPQVD